MSEKTPSAVRKAILEIAKSIGNGKVFFSDAAFPSLSLSRKFEKFCQDKDGLNL